MQVRGPKPNGKNVFRGRAATFSGSKLSGSHLKGFGKKVGFCCISKIGITKFTPAGITRLSEMKFSVLIKF